MHVYWSRCCKLSYIHIRPTCICWLILSGRGFALLMRLRATPCAVVVLPGNRRAAALIHVSTVTQMDWQGIPTSVASLLHILARPGSERPSVLKRDAALGIWRYFTGMNMLSANNTLSGWAETQYSALFTPPHHKLHSCERMKVCTQGQRDKKNNPQCCLSTPTKITMWAVHKKNIHIF